MQFQVPQFLDVEDKIIGPFTIKQFLYLAGGAGLGYLCFHFVPLIGWFLFLAMVGFGAALAFYKYNTKPLVYLLETAFNFIRHDRLYVWRRREKEEDAALDLSNFKPTKHTGKMLSTGGESKLNDLTWSIDVQTENEVETKKVHSDNTI
jgi:hypothetical protein